MSDDKYYEDELLSDEDLDNVAGGYADESRPKYKLLALMEKHANFELKLFLDKPNEYYVGGKQITRDEAFALYQKLYDQGVFKGFFIKGNRNNWDWGDERADLNPACMSAAFINGDITGGEDF